MKNFLLAVTIIVASMPVAAQKNESHHVVVKQVVDTVSKFRDAVACAEEDIKPSNVFTMKPLKNGNENAKYVVLYKANLGCDASEIYLNQIAIVNFGQFNNPMVSITESTPAVDFPISLVGIERIVSTTEDSITIDTSEHTPGDANCCPSLRVRYIVKLNEMGNWRVIKKQPLPPKK